MRAAVQQASQAANTAASTGAGYGAAGQGIASTLTPFLTRELTSPTGYTPEQMNAMLTAGEQGAGGAAAGIAGQANLQAARSRNLGGFGMALDQAARDKMQTLSQNALNVQVQNAALQQQKQQDAAKALQGLYGTDVSAALEAQGLIPKDVGAEAQAGSTGWFQNMTGLIGALGGAARGAGAMGVKI